MLTTCKQRGVLFFVVGLVTAVGASSEAALVA
jgi:hypothetical protein